MSETFAIVLAAGRSKRMNSNIPKVAHTLQKKPLLQWTLDAVLESGVKYIMTVISRSPILEKIIQENYTSPTVRFCYQDDPLGTAHAVQTGLKALTSKKESDHTPESAHTAIPRPWDEKDKILVAYGDTPTVKSETYKKLLQFHEQERNGITIAAFYANNPFGYGRILIDEGGQFLEIREEKDCSDEQKKINLCHSGVMCANYDILDEILPEIKNKNQAKEFYLTDIIRIAKSLGHKVGFIASNHENEFAGVNTQEQLKSLEASVCAG